MRLLIAKLTSTSVQSVSVALNSETDIADLATDLDNCIKLLRSGGYDLVLLITSQGRLRARDAISRLRREAGRVPMVVLTEPGGHDIASLGGATHGDSVSGVRDRPVVLDAGAASGMQEGSHPFEPGWTWQDGAMVPLAASPAPPPNGSNPVPDDTETGLDRSPAARPRDLITVDPTGETLRAGGRAVALSQAEARIFGTLWARRGRIVTADELMNAIYGEAERPASRVLPVFLFKLRRKLAGLGHDDLIETAVGRGFMIRAGRPQPAA